MRGMGCYVRVSTLGRILKVGTCCLAPAVVGLVVIVVHFAEKSFSGTRFQLFNPVTLAFLAFST